MKAIILSTVLFGLHSLVNAKAPPNIIIVYMDDMGYNDLSANTKESIQRYPGIKIPNYIETPRLDKMAAEGARFTDFYSASSVCTPSRAALLTGSYPMRTGSNAVTGASATGGLNPNEITIADLLKRKSYATAAIGKWHLGVQSKFSATAQGFDSYFGIPYSNDMWLTTLIPLSKTIKIREGYTLETLKLAQADNAAIEKYTKKEQVPLVLNDSIIEYPADQSTLTKRYTDEAIKYIEKNSQEKRPFFLYLAQTVPHTPLFVSEGFKKNPSCATVGGTAGCGLYADVVEEFDFHMGRMLDAVKSAGIDSNTLIIFSSDNGHWTKGPENQGSSMPFQGAKFSAWEGGHREPTIMRWPGTIPQGIIQSSITSTIDILPTIAAIVGIPLPLGKMIEGKPYAIDGLNIYDRMITSDTIPRGKPFYYQEANEGSFLAVREGPWKYTHGTVGQNPGTKALYNLANDIQEKTDVTASHLAIKNDLEKKLLDFIAKMNIEKRSMGTSSTPNPPAGCTNPDAANFNPNAMRDDGMCKGVTSVFQREQMQDSKIQISRVSGTLVFTFSKPGKMDILNTFGKTVFSIHNPNALHFTIPEKQFTPGIYFVKFATESNRVNQKLLVY